MFFNVFLFSLKRYSETLNGDISRRLFHFFEIFIFGAARGIKEQKIAQNEKSQLHPSQAISQEQYSI